MSTHPENSKHVTVLLPGGRVDPSAMQKITLIAKQFNLTAYCTTAQNMRLLGATERNLDEIKKALTGLGLQVKVPGRFPKPKVCVGKPFCNLGLVDTFSLANLIAKRFGVRSEVKPKLKIAIAACPASCSGALLVDIGIVATRSGYDLYVGGKGGPLPRVGERIARGLGEDDVLEAVGRLVDFHNSNTSKKQRMFKLLEDPDLPVPGKD